jgi:GTP-binding protein
LALKITSSRFEASAYRAEDEPSPRGPLAVFLGRSNVGKSSLINALLGTRGLARTSATPGRTQSVNFYLVNDAYHFVDLPGYGFAQAPEAIRSSWRGLVEGFLERRSAEIALALLVVDARRDPTELDDVMRVWLEDRGVPYVVAATKSDKLSGNERTASERSLRDWVSQRKPLAALVVSARTGKGVRELWAQLDPALARGRIERSQGEKWTSAN